MYNRTSFRNQISFRKSHLLHLPLVDAWCMFPFFLGHPCTRSHSLLEHIGEHTPPQSSPKLPRGQCSSQYVPKYPGLHAVKNNIIV